jgi:hypothetical protein
MTVAELFRSVSWPSVRNAFARLYPPDEDLCLTDCKLCPELEDVFTDVKEKTCAPNENGMTVHVRFVPASEFSEEYYDVSGKLPNDDTFYGLDFSSFSQWASYLVAEEALASLPPEEIAAHILWEMTFHGFSDTEIEEERKKIEKAFEDIESGKAELIPLEEVLKELNEDGQD